MEIGIDHDMVLLRKPAASLPSPFLSSNFPSWKKSSYSSRVVQNVG